MALVYKEFTAPEGVTDFQTIVMRELTVEDEKTIALWCDKKLRESPGVVGMEDVVRKMESLRRSIAAVDGEPTSEDLPFSAFNNWKQATMTALMAFFNDINGVNAVSLKKVLAEAKVVPPPRKRSPGPATSVPSED